jgi:SAM-dependent methyltransferase
MGEALRERWIAEATAGCSFAEVGGLWGIVNEQVTVAARAGATDLTMIDVAPEDGPDDLWSAFRERLAERRVGDVRCLRGNIDEPETLERAGSFDVVHCSGVLYHCPEPLRSLRNLRRLVRGTLVLGTATVPELVETDAGSVAVEPGSALLVPAMSDRQRAVLGEWLAQNGAVRAFGVNHEVGAGWGLDRAGWNPYEAWWWFFTPEYVGALLATAGFEVREVAGYWNGRATLFLASPSRLGE